MLYRFYTGSGAGDLAWVPAAPECRDDPQALLIAMKLATERRGAEAWRGARLVCRVPPKQRVTLADSRPRLS